MKPSESKKELRQVYEQAVSLFRAGNYRDSSLALKRLAKSTEKSVKLQLHHTILEFYCEGEFQLILNKLCQLHNELRRHVKKGADEADFPEFRNESPLLLYNMAQLLRWQGCSSSAATVLKEHLYRKRDSYYFRNFIHLQIVLDYAKQARALSLYQRLLFKLRQYSILKYPKQAPTGLLLGEPTPVLGFDLATSNSQARFLFSLNLGAYALSLDLPQLCENSLVQAQKIVGELPESIQESSKTVLLGLLTQHAVTFCDYRKAMRLLSLSSKCGVKKAVTISNTALLYISRGKHNMAHSLLSKAVKGQQNSIKKQGGKSSKHIYFCIQFNRALNFLQMKQYRQAYLLFKSLVLARYQEHLFWYRFGQSILGYLRVLKQQNFDTLGSGLESQESEHASLYVLPEKQNLWNRPTGVTEEKAELMRQLIEEASQCFNSCLYLVERELQQLSCQLDIITAVRGEADLTLEQIQNARDGEKARLRTKAREVKELIRYVKVCRGQHQGVKASPRQQPYSGRSRLYILQSAIQLNRLEEAKTALSQLRKKDQSESFQVHSDLSFFRADYTTRNLSQLVRFYQALLAHAQRGEVTRLQQLNRQCSHSLHNEIVWRLAEGRKRQALEIVRHYE